MQKCEKSVEAFRIIEIEAPIAWGADNGDLGWVNAAETDEFVEAGDGEERLSGVVGEEAALEVVGAQ